MISSIWKSICTSNYKQIFSLYYASLIWTHQNSCLLIFLLNSTDSIKIKISNSIHFSKSKIFQLQNFNRYLNTYFFLSHQNCIKISNEKLTNIFLFQTSPIKIFITPYSNIIKINREYTFFILFIPNSGYSTKIKRFDMSRILITTRNNHVQPESPLVQDQ